MHHTSNTFLLLLDISIYHGTFFCYRGTDESVVFSFKTAFIMIPYVQEIYGVTVWNRFACLLQWFNGLLEAQKAIDCDKVLYLLL